MINIWIIEDNERYRKSLITILEQNDDIKCTNDFDSCEAAISTIKKNKSSAPQVILLDLGLPGMGGIAGIPELLSLDDNLLIIVLTVFEDKRRVFDAIVNGASGYLLKSADSETIYKSIHQVLDGGSSLSPRIASHVLEAFSSMKKTKEENLLTPREKNILELLADGLIKKQVAEQLGISYHTVDFYVRKIYKKLQVNNISGALSQASKKGIL